MKDRLEKYLEQNRDQMDTYTPSKENWNAIQNKLKPKKSKKRFYLYAAALAIMIIGSNFIKQNLFDESDNGITQFESSSDTIALDKNQNLDYIEWDSKKTLGHAQSKQVNHNNNLPPTIIITSDPAPAYSYTWDHNQTYSFSTSKPTGNYQIVVTDDNGCSIYPSGISTYANFSRGRGNGYISFQQQNQIIPDDVAHYYEQYDEFEENDFEFPLQKPLSTFGIDVDGASYSNVRRFITSGYLPPKDAVKLEEMINYFSYDLPEPEGEHPFSITSEVAECPWDNEHQLMQVALKGEHVAMDEDQSNNLVFLIDVSGSMDSPEKLPLLKKSMRLLVEQMGDDDKMAIVVYAGQAGLVLPSTSGEEKAEIYEALERLEAGGSTAGGEGILLAYKVAEQEFLKDGNNRIILATDGDFNVGVSDDESLVKLIEAKRETGVYLSVLGFGTGNIQSSKMEKLADNGNGNYYYIDNLMEAKKVLVDEIGGTLVTIAKDVKLQIEFNPEYVKSYRLLGYENRILQDKDFDDDTKDAGDLGSGHTVIALYEIIPQDKESIQYATNLRYQKKSVSLSNKMEDEIAIVKFRYKKPDSKKSKLIEKIVLNEKGKMSNNLGFASAVAEFGLLIRESKYRGNASFKSIIERAKKHKGKDEHGYRAEFIQLVEKAQLLMHEYLSSVKYLER